MPSRTSFFNRTVFVHDLKRWWPLTAGFTLLWLMLLPLVELTEFNHRAGMLAAGMQREALSLAGGAGYWVAFFTAILFAMAAFSYLTNPRATNGLHALSARRETLYVTHCLAALCSQLVPQLLAVALVSAVLSTHGAFSPRVTGLMLLALMLPTVFFFFFAVFCMMFTGQILAAPVFYGVLNILVVGVETLIRALAGNFLYGWAGSSDPALLVFSPLIKLIAVRVRSEVPSVRTEFADGSYELRYLENGAVTLNGLEWLLIYAAVGLVFAALGLLVYRSRQSEATGSTVAIGWAKPIFKYGVAFCAALALGQLFYYLFFGKYRSNGDYSLTGTLACMAAAGLIGYFAAEMLLKKSFRVWQSGWKGAAAVTAALVLLGFVASFDLTGYEKYIPDAAQVESAYVDFYGMNSSFSVTLRDPETIRLLEAAHGAVVRDKQRQIETARSDDSLFDEDDSFERVSQGWFNVTYQLKNGRQVERSYGSLVLWAEELGDPASPAAAMTALFNAPETALQRAVSGRGNLPNGDPRALPDLRFTGGYVDWPVYDADDNYDHSVQHDLTAGEAKLLFEAVLHDAEAGRVGTSLFGSSFESPLTIELYANYRDLPDNVFSTRPNDDDGYGRASIAFTPTLTRQMTETIATLRAMDIDAQLD